jgi:RNA polymerase sigma-70 factor (ECF subfamily)
MDGSRDQERHSGELLDAGRSGDRDALEALVVRHLPRLRAFARLRMSPLLRAREAAEDLVQSACVQILRALPAFEYRGEEAFRGWLYTAVTNKLLEHERELRAQCRDVRREVVHDPGEGAGAIAQVYGAALSPSQRVIAAERLVELEAAFDALPDHYREVLTLSRIARLSRAAIATRLGRSEGSVRNLITRALAELGRQLERRRLEKGS